MSVHKDRTQWRVKWREGDRQRSRTFARKKDAELFDADLVRRRRLGSLALLDAGTETLDDYVAGTWVPTYAVHLAPKTRGLYEGFYVGHISPTLGEVRLRDLTPEMIRRWQAERLAAGAGRESIRKSLTLLGGILQRAVEDGRLRGNPARLVRKVPGAHRVEVRPLAPAAVEAMRAALGPRDATLVSVLAYAGLRPGEALGLRWSDVRERTLLVERALSLGAAKGTKTGAARTVRLLGPLAQDLEEWRMLSGRPGDRALVFPARDGSPWSESAYKSWSRRAFVRGLAAAGVEARVYDLRHSFASLLLHEGRSVIYVARQLGHGANLTLGTYGHVIDELEAEPRQDAESAILSARRSWRASRAAVPA